MSRPAWTQGLLLLVGIAVAAAAGWFIVPQPEPPSTIVQVRRAAWGLAELPPRPDLLGAAARVAVAPFWGAPERQEPVIPGEDTRWRVAAVFGGRGALKLRIEFRNPRRPPVFLSVGSQLPSGHRIVEINEREYCVEIDGARYRFPIESLEQ